MTSHRIRRYSIVVLLLCALAYSCRKEAKETPAVSARLTLVGESAQTLPAEGGTLSFRFISNQSWTVACDESWITANPLSGEASDEPQTVIVSVESNSSLVERSGIIVIRAGVLSEEVFITQSPALEYEVQMSDFSAMRGALKIGGILYTPKGFKGRMPAIICCHALSGSLSDVVVYADAAARLGFAACCFDFCGGPRGYSLSDGERSDNTILTEVQDVSAVYDALASREDIDPERVFVMGGSQGGLVAALYAAGNPDGVRGLGLLFPAFNLPDLVRFYTDLYGGLDRLPESLTMFGHTIWRQYAIDAYDLYPFDVIGQYEGPVIILHGDRDEMVPLSYSERAAKIYKNASLTVLDGQNHGFNYLGVKQAIECLKLFLSGNE